MILSNQAQLSRLAIFVFYDRDGIVDDYVCELLSLLKQKVERMIIISNSSLSSKEKRKLQMYSPEVYERENYGLDAAAYQQGLLKHVGRENAEEYDEIIMVNDTFFGPFESFDKIFHAMNKKDLDFWGLSYGQKTVDNWGKVKYGYIPDHIQTFFVAFRKSMLQNNLFWDYWINYDNKMNDFLDVVTKHEMIMTKYFSDLGFKWDVYADQSRYTSYIKELNFNNYHYASFTMLSEMNFPFLKKKALLPDRKDYLFKEHGEEVNKALNYVISNTDYDEKLIWENLLRLNNIADLKSSFNLNLVFPKYNNIKTNVDCNIENIAIVVRLQHKEFLSVIFDYLNKINKNITIYIIAENEHIKNDIECMERKEHEYILLGPSNQETEMGAFVLCCEEILKKHKYICFTHDAVIRSHAMALVKDEIVKTRFENTIVSDRFIEQVIQYFKDNPHVGLMETPFNTFNDYFYNYKNRWHGYYEDTVSLLNELEVKTNILPEKEPISIDCAFWCRSDALLPLWNRKYKAEEFICHPITESNSLNEALLRALPYIAQSQGYYTGIIMNDEFAATEIENAFYYLRDILLTTEKLGCTAGFYAGYIQQLESLLNSGYGVQVIGLRQALSNYYHKHLPDYLCKILDKMLLKRG